MIDDLGNLTGNARARRIELLIGACHWLLLEPENEEPRRALALLAGSCLVATEGDTLLVTSLFKEVSAHADDLAFRLEEPGNPALYIRATTARLCQTLTILKEQMAILPAAHAAIDADASVTRVGLAS